MTRYVRPVLLTLALMASATAALCQKTDQKAKPEEGKAKDPPASQSVQRGAPNDSTALGLSPNFKHAPNVPILKRIIDLDLNHSTVREAAEAITRASGVTIRVDSKVPTDARLDVTALTMPLTTVLEVIALKTQLAIAPDGNGVLLKPWPTLDVSGHKQVLVGRNEPWSDEWDALVRPTNVPPGVRPTPGTNNTLGTTAFFAIPVTQNGNEALRTNNVVSFVPAWGGVSLTALNDHAFVVAEPALGQHGENGVMLTLYRIDGAQLRVAGATFHKLAMGGTGAPAGLLPGVKDLNKDNSNQTPLQRGVAPNPPLDFFNPFAFGLVPADKKADPSDSLLRRNYLDNITSAPVPGDKKIEPANLSANGNGPGTKPAQDGQTKPAPKDKSTPANPPGNKADPKNTPSAPTERKAGSTDSSGKGNVPENTTPAPGDKKSK